jgi:hypothetical protein
LSLIIKIILVTIAAVLLAGGMATANLAARHHTMQYEAYVSTSLQIIDDWNHHFDSTDDHDRRVDLYYGLNSNHIEYINRESGNDAEIANRYETTLLSMKEQIFNHYYVKITEVEELEIPDLLTEVFPLFKDNAERLYVIKNEISDDGIFNNDTVRLNQLKDKADDLIGYFTEASIWLSSIAEQNERFSKALRDEKFVVFNDILRLQKENDNSDFSCDLVVTELRSAIDEKHLWFYEWYKENISSLQLAVTYIFIAEDEDEETIAPEEADDEICERNLLLNETIIAMVQLNDLTRLFASERDVLFSRVEIARLLDSINDVTSSGLESLERIGNGIINSKHFRDEAIGKAIEHFDESFTTWKENHRNNEHLITLEAVLQEAIEVGQTEHDKIIEAERQAARRAARSRTTWSSGFT